MFLSYYIVAGAVCTQAHGVVGYTLRSLARMSPVRRRAGYGWATYVAYTSGHWVTDDFHACRGGEVTDSVTVCGRVSKTGVPGGVPDAPVRVYRCPFRDRRCRSCHNRISRVWPDSWQRRPRWVSWLHRLPSNWPGIPRRVFRDIAVRRPCGWLRRHFGPGAGR